MDSCAVFWPDGASLPPTHFMFHSRHDFLGLEPPLCDSLFFASKGSGGALIFVRTIQVIGNWSPYLRFPSCERSDLYNPLFLPLVVPSLFHWQEWENQVPQRCLSFVYLPPGQEFNSPFLVSSFSMECQKEKIFLIHRPLTFLSPPILSNAKVDPSRFFPSPPIVGVSISFRPIACTHWFAGYSVCLQGLCVSSPFLFLFPDSLFFVFFPAAKDNAHVFFFCRCIQAPPLIFVRAPQMMVGKRRQESLFPPSDFLFSPPLDLSHEIPTPPFPP